jgi:hypothetical protein
VCGTALLFGHEKLHLRELGHPVQPVKVNKSQRPTSDEVWIFLPQPKVAGLNIAT